MIEDEKLLERVKGGDNEAQEILLSKYKPLVSAIANKYYLVGADKEDLIQEGWIGLFKAINTYDKDKNNNFVKFASTVIMREIVSAIRRENTNKNQALDSSVLIDDDILPSVDNPEKDILSAEIIQKINEDIDKLLSAKERIVVKYFVQGYSYMDIAKMLDIKPKSVDNTLTRIKNKLKHIKENLWVM